MLRFTMMTLRFEVNPMSAAVTWIRRLLHRVLLVGIRRLLVYVRHSLPRPCWRVLGCNSISLPSLE
jgi:hypothetical protein